MYISFYNLTQEPFAEKPDQQFLWLGEQHKEALATLRYGVLENKGFLLLTGEAGTGKTTVINALTDGFDESTLWAVLPDPTLERIDFYNAIANGFGVEKTFASKVQFLIQFSHYLHQASSDNKRVVLLVDDCHRLSQEMLEELRLLSNIEKADSKLINIFFVGQKKFNEMLVQPQNRAVRQRLTMKAELQPLDLEETDDYIRHRLKVAGTTEKIFNIKAVKAIHKSTLGVPKRINVLCQAALANGATIGAKVIDHRLIEECVGKLNRAGATKRDSEHETPGTSTAAMDPASIPIAGNDASKVTGFNLERDHDHRWWKIGVPALVVALVVGYFWFAGNRRETPLTVEPPVVVTPKAPEKKDFAAISSSPALAVLENDRAAINRDKADELKTAILQKVAGDEEKATTTVLTEGQEPSRQSPEDQAVDQSTVSALPVDGKDGRQQLPAAMETPAEPVEPAVAPLPEQITAAAVADTMPEIAPGAVAEVTESVRTPEKTTSVDDEGAVAASPQTVEEAPAEVERDNQVMVTEAPPPPPPPAMRKVILPLQANKTKLTAAGRRNLEEFLELLAPYPRTTLLVKGYVSAKTNSAENIQLSKDRAEAVMEMLVAEGIDPERIEVMGMGNQEPLATNDTYEGRRKNRRVEIEIIDDTM